ncbi:histone H4 transcription factor [Zerene cesonia]|uniref:histone H4 transcription factor n=1 Tax=Zerene cesonia TaxID=33412 RepID=UPI0018E55FCB|nr:histone H4 transcription factor [Zerene cesonia]XP_038222050.1 histone H4 transcription factor [Zerene cesonia]
MAEIKKQSLTTKERIARCIEWLKTQNNPKKLSLQNKNDIQFIIETNAHRKKFFLTAEDDATVPAGVDDIELEPRNVPVKYLRTQQLCLECEWPSCRLFFSNYIVFQVHVASHIGDVHVIEKDSEIEYVCLWDVCGHKTIDKYEIVRHINYHAYHAKLLAIGFNARATLKLERCKKDSTKRNVLPPLKGDHCCMWYECNKYFNSMQNFLDHIKEHIRSYDIKEMVCSWAGCGMSFYHRGMFATHVRSHTGERLIACYHCGQHFALNRKLLNHLLRQNVDPSLGQQCSICKQYYATAYLLREHVRQHVSCYACSMCDMSSPSKTGLAQHIRYRHMRDEHVRTHQCALCEHRAKTSHDLKKHMVIHKKRNPEDSDDSDYPRKKPRERRQYICHMCPSNKRVVFTRGTRLTTHLVKQHEARWPCGHSRFRYQKSEDGFYRLTTTRFEVLEISKKIVDGYQGPKAKLTNKFNFDLKPVAEATASTPKRFEITLKNAINEPSDDESDISENVKDDEEVKENINNKENNKLKEEANTDVIENEKQDTKVVKRKADRRVKEKKRVPSKKVKVKEENLGIEEDLKVNVPETENIAQNNSLVIEMCDVDAQGNIIKTETIESNIMYSYDK